MISVVIPVREGGNPYTTLASLAGQIAGCEVIVSWDHGHGANWARNRGAERARGEFLLFSDDDIEWLPGSLECLLATLRVTRASYAYGCYEMGGKIQCDVPFDASRLRRANFISTMTLIRRDAFHGFDESIHRLQDWDFWLECLRLRKIGAYCGKLIFTTKAREGITSKGMEDYARARRVVSRKHGLGLS